ncbi:Fic family protein [Legionella qingyii]|uniref:Fic family protein n=1 Tax=Legionella qingyii TaxID=2184757 RepID=UPI000F8D74EA|nr:Fic family protein [Legionella qingyii]RUR29224.1 Fic family protein [Legionella qingyii]
MIKIANTTEQAKQLSKEYLEGKLRRIYHGIYTDDLKSEINKIVIQNWMKIIPHIVSEGILAFSTASDLKPKRLGNEAIIFVISSYVKTINLPGLTIKVYKGNNHDFIDQILPNLFKSNMPRTLLENLSTVRGSSYIGIKTIGVEGVEKILAKELRTRGEESINQIRDEAKDIAKELGYQKEYQKLNQIISALLSTHTHENILFSNYAKAVAQKKPYDEHRVQFFDELTVYLNQCTLLTREYEYTAISFKNLSFYESYFSNFIEGTEFIIDEAEDIVFKGIEVNNRHADSHDVLSNFIITNDYSEMSITPDTPDELIEILQRRHAILMKERPEKRPGEFKIKENKAGNTLFVSPEDVLGTLYQGFERYILLKSGIEKALFMQFLISEVHPFDDGNGRLSRIMMNAELVSQSQYKIIIPNVHRDNYLNGLRLASRDKNFRTYVKIMDQAQAYTSSVNWLDYGEAREKLENDGANLSSDEGIPTFNRALRTLKLSNIPA